MMLMYNTQSPLPPEDQVTDRLLFEIREGIVPAGTELPPAYRLAHLWDVPRSAVEKAYRTLAARGVLVLLGNVPIVRGPQAASPEGDALQQAAKVFADAAVACDLTEDEAIALLTRSLDAVRHRSYRSQQVTCG